MKTKEKNKGNLIIGIIIIAWIIIIGIYYLFNDKQISYAYSEETEQNTTQISNAEKVDLETIINKNTQVSTREEIVVEETELEYITKYRNNDQLLKGTTQISQEGRNGTQQIITKKTYNEKGEIISEEQISAKVVKSSIDKVVDIGTAEPKKQQATTKKSNGKKGLSFDINLNEPSGFSQEEFKKVLTDSKDKNKIFENNSEYFYLIEEEYNINGIFVAAVGIHESGWGTSKLAKSKYNLFGYGAYDSNPYNGAYSFTSYSECIDLIARVFVKYYINAPGTKIYDGQAASGKYYSGSTLSAINKKYASDKNWANSVYTYMEYLYNKI